jgi:hypothetical protein
MAAESLNFKQAPNRILHNPVYIVSMSTKTLKTEE